MTGEFAHYGVKGMKWGVRKEYIPHPRKRNSTISSSSSKRKLTKSERRARNRKIAIGLLAASATIAVGAVAYTAYKKNGKEFFDTVIKSGTTFQRLTSRPDEQLNRIYATYKRGDNVRYTARLGALQKKWHGETYVKKFSALKEIRAPSDKKAAYLMSKLMSTDPEFNMYVQNLKNANFKRLDRNASTEKSFYKNFNLAGLMDKSEEGQKQVQKFYDLLKANGYNAVTDLNDRKFSTFKANNPVILFDMSDIVERSVKRLDNAEMANAAVLDNLAENGAKYTSAALGITGANLYVSNVDKRKNEKKKVQHSDDIYHYGVKGMKWGVRKDRQIASKKKTKPQPKYKTLSDEELRKRVNRFNLEKQYKQLDYEMNTPERVKFVKKIGKQFVDQAVVSAIIGASAAISRPYVDKLLKKLIARIETKKVAVAHSDDIYHYGVKSMKWGVRKEYIPHPRKMARKTISGLKSFGYKTRSPLVMFDMESIVNDSVKQLDNKEIDKNYLKVQLAETGERTIPLLLAGAGAEVYRDNEAANRAVNKNSKTKARQKG